MTVLFCDVVGSTALGERMDPEPYRVLLARYFERVKAIVESHGGTVDKFVGDAVEAVFGIPVAHEDDALRACRAAVETNEAVPELGLQARIGIQTGEVVAGTAERLVTGDAVNVAARFEQTSAPGEILIGETAYLLVRDAVVVEPVEALELKGKAESVPAFRLLSVLAPPERSHASRFVGRERELELIVESWARVLAESRCELVTIVGEAGVGKSRLVAEALSQIGVRVVRGRCLPYGEGITYRPVVEIVQQLGSLPSDELAAAAIRSLVGQSDKGTSGDEIAWAFRKLLEEQSPLVVVFDDLQWGEETFLDLVESSALLSTDAPLLLLCMARLELVERRPTWPVWSSLQPLAPEESDALIGDAVSGGLRGRIARAAGGNPLFITEMLAMASEQAEVEVPPTLRSLLAMRLDQLDTAERRVLERGSVEGEVFHRGAVQALAPEETQVTPRLTALVRRQLIRPDRARLPGDDGYRFRHLLIRDAAYDALPKSVRADLHRRFAGWLESHGQDLVELEEILGYHLEQAAQYLAELGRPDPALAGEAAGRLATAGRLARSRGDRVAARSLLRRAAALSEHPDVHVIVDLARELGYPREAAELLDGAAERAEHDGNANDAAFARASGAYFWLSAGKVSVAELERLALTALPLLEAAGDHALLADLWHVLGNGVYGFRCQFAQLEDAAEQELRHARLAGQPRRHTGLALALLKGPRPVAEGLARFDVLVEEDDPSRLARVARAHLLAMSNRIEEARSEVQAVEDYLRELGDVNTTEIPAFAEIEQIIAGNNQAVADRYQRACHYLREHGKTAELSTYAPQLGRVLCTLGRFDEAEALADEGRQLGQADDLVTQALWRQAIALVQAKRGNHPDAQRLAREAASYTRQTDSPMGQADALCDLASVLESAGLHQDALAALQEALRALRAERHHPGRPPHPRKARGARTTVVVMVFHL